MADRPSKDGPPPGDPWKRGQFFVTMARLLLDLLRWWQDGGPGRLP